MKKIVLIVVVILTALNVFSQVKQECKADMMADKPGVVIQREYVNISKLKNLSVIDEYVTDLSSNQKLSALDFELNNNPGSDHGETVSTLLDPDEVDGLISFMQSLQDNITKAAAPKNFTEYSFQTLSGFEAGCYWDNGWKVYIKVDVNDDKTNMNLNSEDMAEFISFIKQARTKM